MKPLAIDICCGLGGWAEGLLAEGYDVIGFDIEQHVYGDHRYPAQIVIQDVRTLHGSQFKSAALLVASPPCQKYSYMAMPWTLAKEQAAKIRADTTGLELAQLNELFEACFRIQREACEAAGKHIPMIVENVRGAQPWVGQARWSWGSFYLWGDVPALMPIISKRQVMKAGIVHRNDGATNFHGSKVPGFRFDGNGKSFQSASVEGVKVATMGAGWYPPDHPKHVKGLGFNTHAERNLRSIESGVKQGGDWFSTPGSISRTTGGHSSARKMASAMIAKIPLPLSRYIGKTFHPNQQIIIDNGQNRS